MIYEKTSDKYRNLEKLSEQQLKEQKIDIDVLQYYLILNKQQNKEE
jgi:hypothetical protein